MDFLVPKGRKLIENAYNGDDYTVRDLLRRGANVNVKDKNGSTPLINAIIGANHSGHVEVVRVLLDQKGVLVNVKNKFDRTALIYACDKGHLEIICALLNHEAVDVNVQGGNGWTALMFASCHGHVDVVRALLNHDGVEVNIKDIAGDTALIMASWNGYLEVVRALLNHHGVDANIKNTYGNTALICARNQNKNDVVRLLEEHMEREKGRVDNLQRRREEEEKKRRVEKVQKRREDEERKRRVEELQKRREEEEQRRREEELQKRSEEEERKRREEEERNRRKDSDHTHSMEELRRRLELLNTMPAGNGVGHQPPSGDPPRPNENSPTSEDATIEQDRSKLLHVMNTTSADPVELSLLYIKRCLTDLELGKGAFGDVFLAEDSRLPKKFAVKMISPTHRDEAAIKEIRKTFQTELLTLKAVRHPNIIVLYGYSLNANSTQCLVYEYATNGSLVGFYTDEGNRARLSAGTRLSIMFKLVRAVHFLHTGGCKVKGKAWNVFHRDIKSANICLADDFTPRLIDCGLAKFVPDDNSRASPRLQSTTGGFAFGTPGYMCPVYVKKKGKGHPCPYIAAYDVYSIGIVLVELILGRLNGGQSTRNDTEFHDVFDTYVQDERTYQRIADGCEKLKADADPTIIWNPNALDLACKTAIHCMAPFPEDRLSTKEVLDALREAVNLNTNAGIQHSMAAIAVDDGPFCLICNDHRTEMKCSKGHALCTNCIVDKLGDDNGCQLFCLIKECPSKIHDKDLYGRIPVETYKQYVEKRTERKTLDEWIPRMESKIDRLLTYGQNHQELLQRLAKGLNRSLAGLALLSANQFKKCPNLVWVTPISVDKKDRNTPMKWIRDKGLQKYSVVFICAHSGEKGHAPFEIEVPRRWIVKIAPWLKLCLRVLETIATSQGLPFPIPNLPFLQQSEMMKTFLESAIEKASSAVVAQCEALLENGTVSIEASGQMQTLAGDALKFIAEKAEENASWKAQMVPVFRQNGTPNGTPIWVKGIYEAHYEV